MTPDPADRPADLATTSATAPAGDAIPSHRPEFASGGDDSGGTRHAAASPTVRRRVLASELKTLRKAAGLTHVDIANRLGWQQGKVSKIESAKQGVAIEAVIALAEVCHASADHRERLVRLARAARTKGWWESYVDVLTAGQRTCVGLEADADVLATFAVEAVPELLRTRDYAEATVRARVGIDGQRRAERALEVILERQRSLLQHDGLDLDVVISESGLRRLVGSPEVVRDQCDWLVESAARENVALRVLPFAAGALPVETSFSILDFQRDPHPAVVFVPGEGACAHVENTAEVKSYRETMSELRSLALDPAASVAYLQDLRNQLEQTGSVSA